MSLADSTTYFLHRISEVKKDKMMHEENLCNQANDIGLRREECWIWLYAPPYLILQSLAWLDGGACFKFQAAATHCWDIEKTQNLGITICSWNSRHHVKSSFPSKACGLPEMKFVAIHFTQVSSNGFETSINHNCKQVKSDAKDML